MEQHSTTEHKATDAPPKAASGAFTLATEYLAGMLLFTLAGRWLDARRHTGVLWTVCGLLLGFAFGLYFTWKLVSGLNAAQKPPPANAEDTPSHTSDNGMAQGG
jgi:F0F1-type ATP synthase assembly protein I